MVIYGVRAVELANHLLDRVACPSCEEETALRVTVYRRHFHIFWIPMFPLKKRAIVHCQYCGAEYKKKNIPDNLKLAANMVMEGVKGPLWQFSGLALFILLASFLIVENREMKEQDLAYAANPEVNDILEIKVTDGYTSFKIVEVKTDSVYMIPNDYVSNRIMGLHKIDKEENYNSAPVAMAKADLVLLSNGEDYFNMIRRGED